MELNEFPPISEKQWKQQIQFELNGLDYNKSLLWECNEVNVKPFYTEIDLPLNATRYKTKPKSKIVLKDIVSEYAKDGVWETSRKKAFKTLGALISEDSAITINTSIYQDTGANIIQQLAYALSIFEEYYNYFGNKIIDNIQFKFNISSNFFFEIAKLRAIQNLWQIILEEKKIVAPPLAIITTASSRNKDNTTTNLIKTVTEYSCVKMSETAIKGSYYVENLTKQIIEKSLTAYKLIINNQGFINQIENGNIQRKIKLSASKDSYSTNFIKNIRQTIIEPIPSIKQFKIAHLDSSILKNKLKLNQFNINTNIKLHNQAAGFPPFLRGISSKMYLQKPWKNCVVPTDNTIRLDSNTDITINQELTSILLKGVNQIKSKTNKNPLIFIFDIKGNYYEEIAKLRASRVLWSKIAQKYFNSLKDYTIQIHCIIHGNNIEEKTINTLSAIFGGTQSLSTDKDINNFLTNESYINKVIDPWAGSYLIESITQKLITESWKNISNKL